MRRFTQFLGFALAAAAVSAETRMPEYQNESQPGVLRVSGIEETDSVLLDGELIGNGKRLARFGNKLLINPGEYTVTVRTGQNRTACSYRIAIRENETAVARCEKPLSPLEHNVD